MSTISFPRLKLITKIKNSSTKSNKNEEKRNKTQTQIDFIFRRTIETTDNKQQSDSNPSYFLFSFNGEDKQNSSE
jgi:hypothetical protein